MADNDCILWRCEMTHFGRVTKPAASFTVTACLCGQKKKKRKKKKQTETEIKACRSWKGRPWWTVSATCWPSLAICHLRRHTNRNRCQLGLALSHCGPFSNILLHGYQTLFIHKCVLGARWGISLDLISFYLCRKCGNIYKFLAKIFVSAKSVLFLYFICKSFPMRKKYLLSRWKQFYAMTDFSQPLPI